jgi:hypothetical protein
MDGQASTILYSGFKSGPVSIKATYYHDTIISTTISQIAINAGPPVGEEFGISAKYLNISGLWKANLEDQISVNAADMYGNAIPDTAISFKTYNTGGFFTPNTATTTGGIATNTLHSGGTYLQPLQGFVSVTAEAINGGRTTHITSLAVAPDNNNIIYAGTNGGGVYKSIDSGATWTNISRSSENSKYGQNWIDPYIKGNNAICIDPDDNQKVYVGTGYLGRGNVYRSLDGGMSWNSDNVEEWHGIFSINQAVLTVVCDGEGSDYVWIGTEGLGALFAPDGETFEPSNGLSYGKVVRDMVKVSGTSETTAVLYAATNTGVFRSTNGGQTWSETTPFAGDFVNTLALHPASNGTTDIIYAGTEDAGVWVSTDSGGSWIAYNEGMGKGLSATVPLPDRNNTGNGVINDVAVNPNAKSECWSVECITEDGGTFSVTGTVSGKQSNATVGSAYTSNDSEIFFTIADGSTDFEIGDTFTFCTTRDHGRTIKDLLVDGNNNKLYAITYYLGPLEPHAVGNFYVHGLNSDGSMDTHPWAEANTNLPQYDPPDDTTLFAQHVMALDNPANPDALYLGGEGINLYKATSGIDTGAPEWYQSKSGLTNLIMARMPILFSGECHMEIYEEEQDGSIIYTIYIQDVNGNPPIAGSTFKVEYKQGEDTTVFFDKKYPDTYTYQGTWRDWADISTNIPYITPAITPIPGDEVTFTFSSPECTGDAPGCSGSDQEETYIF